MEITEERVREIVREEIVSARHRELGARVKKMRQSVPHQMMRTEAACLRDMGLDPFEEAEKPKPDWMSYPEAADYRAAGVDPMKVSRESYDGSFTQS